MQKRKIGTLDVSALDAADIATELAKIDIVGDRYPAHLQSRMGK